MSDGHQVKVIEHRHDHIERLQRDLPAGVFVEGSGSDPDVLERAGVRRAAVVAAVTGDDETNLVVTSLARFEFQAPRVIARVNNPKNAWLFTQEMGVDVAVNQADFMAHLIAEEMSLGDMMTLLKLRKGQYALVEEKIHPTAVAIGRSVQDLDLPAECVLTAVIRQGQLILPRGATVLAAGDEVLALVHSSQAQWLAALLGPHNS
jgi:trk system potassium uptake protein TrkA